MVPTNIRIILLAAILPVLIVGAFVLWPFDTAEDLPIRANGLALGEVYQEGEPIGRGFIEIAFPDVEPEVDYGFLHAAIDRNDDGVFAEDEWVVENMLARLFAREVLRYHFAIARPLPEGAAIRIEITAGPRENEAIATRGEEVLETREARLRVARHDIGGLLALGEARDPAHAIKGIPTAFAHGVILHDEYHYLWHEVPDLMQDEALCGPTVAADIMLAHAEDFNELSLLPERGVLIDELAEGMQWTRQDGVTPDALAAGINALVNQQGLSTRAQKVGSDSGERTLGVLFESLERGGLGIVHIRFVTDNGVIGSHALSLSGIHNQEGRRFIEVQDPATPEGNDVYRVEDTRLLDYGVFPGDVQIAWGIAYGWEDPETGRAVYDPMDADELVETLRAIGGDRVPTILLDGKHVPKVFVTEVTDEICATDGVQHPHYHSDIGYAVTALDGTLFYDDGGCGLGRVGDIPEGEIEL